MLTELIVRNFALIDELQLQLRPGFTVLTGETGAGKSIIVDALGAALGARMGAETIRDGTLSALAEAVFENEAGSQAASVIQETGLGDDDAGPVILSREITDGGSRYRINRRAGTLGLLKNVSQHLADIHGQHEHQRLIHPATHLSYLDGSGDVAHAEVLNRYISAYSKYSAVRAELSELRTDEQERARRLDILNFQIDEIQAADLQPGEEEELSVQRKRLQAGEKLREAVAAARILLTGDDETSLGGKDALQEAAIALNSVSMFDPELAQNAEELERIAYQADDICRVLNNYIDGIELDPAVLENIEARLDAISGLKRKYGNSISEILAFLHNATAEAQRLSGSTERLAELGEALSELSARVGAEAAELSKARRQIACQLSDCVMIELRELGMSDTRFEVEFTTADDLDGILMPDGARLRANGTGVDIVQFLMSANPGEPLMPLVKVASGGELSRLMLALKSVGVAGSEVPTIVFDEIDVGIGGVTAHHVGRKLMGLSRRAQVLCVTHLPQVATFADHHLVVAKHVSNGRTTIDVRELNEDERVEEIARMYGDREGQAAMAHAKQALASAAEMRARLFA